MTELASASSHAEQRDMRSGQRDIQSDIQKQLHYNKEADAKMKWLIASVVEIKETMATDYATNASAHAKIEKVMALVSEMKEARATEYIIHASASIELRQKSSEIQLV